MGVNIICAILIIPFNKWLFKTLSFKWVITLSLLHFAATYISSVLIVQGSTTMEKKHIPWQQTMPISILNVISICSLNMSLSSNSIGVYQLAKMLTVPGTVLFSWLFYGRTYSLEVLGTLALMTSGIGLAVGGRVELDLMGSIYALVGVAAVCAGSVMMGELQKRTRLDPTYITSHIMGSQLVLLAVVVLTFESVLPMQANSIFEYHWRGEAIFCVVATTAFAVLLNLSGAWVLGAFNAVTYSVVGYFKTVAVLATGILVFGDEFSALIGTGIVLVLVGSVLYNRAK